MDFVKEDYLLGNKKVIVGDNLHDLVLENLGKIYIRCGSSYKEFNSIINSIETGTSSENSIIIEEDGLGDATKYKDGLLIWDAKAGILYLFYDGEFLPLAEDTTKSLKYVRKTGDTMTGLLEIQTSGAPLKVTSADEVVHFNSNYLLGYVADDFARKRYDESITGNWTFDGKNTFNNTNSFNDNTYFYDTAIFSLTGSAAIKIGTGDLITDGSLGSSSFSSGYAGYGWRMDANTNTLELDNLIVRGIMQVYELLVNKIYATNGSFWITDSFEVSTVNDLYYIDCAEQLIYKSSDTSNPVELKTSNLILGAYYIPYNFSTKDNVYIKELDLTDGALAEKTSVVKTGTKNYVRFNYMICVLAADNLSSYLTDLCKEDTVNTLASDNVIDKINIGLKVTTSTSLDEQLGSTTITPRDPEFDELYYTVLVAQNEGDLYLVDNEYLFKQSTKCKMNLYYKYFGLPYKSDILSNNNMYLVTSKEGEYPVFRPGDILRCLRFTGTAVKQYHAVVLSIVGSYTFLILLQLNTILNLKTEYQYDDNGNLVSSSTTYDSELYSRSETIDEVTNGNGLTTDTASDVQASTTYTPALKDTIVRIGSIYQGTRRNGMYLTSSEDYSPYEDVLVGINRPDYTVTYFIPKYKTITTNVNNHETDYYIQNKNFNTVAKIYFQNNKSIPADINDLIVLESLAGNASISAIYEVDSIVSVLESATYKTMSLPISATDDTSSTIEPLNILDVNLTWVPKNSLYNNQQLFTMNYNGDKYFVTKDTANVVDILSSTKETQGNPNFNLAPWSK